MKGFLSRLKPKKDQDAPGAAPEESASKPEGQPQAAQGAAAPGQKGQEQKIVLELGDLLNRIPGHLLKPGAHDAAQRIFFKMSDLSSNLAEGKATIPLSSIASRCPEIFRKEIGPEDDVEIFFPWSKLLERVRNYKAMVDQPQGGEKNPAMHYKGQGAPTPAIRFRQNVVSTPTPPARPVEPAAPSPAPAGVAQASTGNLTAPVVPPAPEKEKAEPTAAPSEAPLTSTTPMSPLASRRLKQNWFNAAPALTQLPATEPASSAPAPTSAPSNIPGPTIPGPQASAKQTVLGTLAAPPESTPAAPAAKTLSLATEPSPPAPALSLEKPAAASAKSGERSAEALAKECATLFEEKAKLAAEFTRAKEIHQNLLEKLTVDREAAIDENNKTLLQLAEMRTDYEKKLQALRDDHHKQIAAAKGEGASAQQQAGAQVANIVKQKDEELAKSAAGIEARNKQIEAAGKQLEAVGQERDTIHGHKVKLEQELASAKDQYRKEIEAALEARDTIWVEKDEIAGKLHKAAKEHAEKAAQAKAEHEKSTQSSQENFNRQIAALKEQHEKSLAEKESLLSKHGEAAEQQRNSLIKQKDEELAKLRADLEGHKKQIGLLGKEKADALQSASEKHAADVKAAESLHQEANADFEKQIAALKAEHERRIAEKESLLSKHGEAADQQRNTLLKEKEEALAKANAEIEGHKKQIAALREEHERKLSEKESLLSKHGEAGQQLNALIKERDAALTGLAAEIDTHKKQIEALGKEKADTASKHAEDLKAADALHHEASQSARADFEKQIAALKEEHHHHITERDSLLSKHGEAAEQQRNSLIKQMDESLDRLGGELETHRKQIETLTQEKTDAAARHASDLQEVGAQHEKALAAANQSAQQDRDKLTNEKDLALAGLAAEVEGHKKQIETLGREKAEALKLSEKHSANLKEAVAQHSAALQSTREDFAKQMAVLKEEQRRMIAEKESLLSKQGEAADRERNALIKQKDEKLAALATEIEGHKRQAGELDKKVSDSENAKKKLGEELAQARQEHERKIKSLHEDFARQLAASKEEHGRTVAEKESLLSKKLQAGEQERANAIQQKDAAIARLTSDIESHRKQIETLGKERDTHRDAKMKAEAELHTTKEQQRRQIDSLTRERDSLAKEKEVVAAKLADAVKSNTEKLNAATAERDRVLKAKEEALGQIKTTAEAHTKETQSLARERDRLVQEARQFQQRLEESAASLKQAQEAHAQKTAELVKQRDEAVSAAGQQRGAHEKVMEQIHKHKDSLTAERDKALAAQKEAIEAKRAQWVVFGNEYNQTIRQRDEALTQLADTKVELKKSVETLSKEKDAMLVKLHKSLADQETRTNDLAQKLTELARQNEAVKAELYAVKEAHRKEFAATVEAHQAEAVKLTGERDSALKANEEMMTLPRIRPVSVPPPSIQPSKTNS